jgi:hypothetical protein
MKKRVLSGFLGVTALLLFFSRGPDIDLHFYRVIPSAMEVTRIERNLGATSRWPQWFHSLQKVTPVSNQAIQPGSVFELQILPHRGGSKPFVLTMEVTDYIPAQKLSLKLIHDSSSKLTRLFDQLNWEIQILPDPQGSRIIGSAVAHTKTWRARLFGRISEKILMNQIFYPDLIRLAELRQPFSAELDPKALGLSGPDS